MNSRGDQSVLKELEELLSRDPPGRVFRMGESLHIHLSESTFLIVSPTWLEVTICKPHVRIGEHEDEEATIKAIITDFRLGLGARLLERGWREVDISTTETTMADKSTASQTVTEVVSRIDIGDAKAAFDEIMWLKSRV